MTAPFALYFAVVGSALLTIVTPSVSITCKASDGTTLTYDCPEFTQENSLSPMAKALSLLRRALGCDLRDKKTYG